MLTILRYMYSKNSCELSVRTRKKNKDRQNTPEGIYTMCVPLLKEKMVCLEAEGAMLQVKKSGVHAS